MNEEQRARNDEIARRLGKSVGRFGRAARAAARSAQPEAERLARQARPAAEKAGQFLRAHESEIRQVAGAGARAVAYKSTSPMLRPVIVTVADELTRRPGGSKGQKRSADTDGRSEQA